MTVELNADGLLIETLEEIQTSITSDIHAAISPNLNLSSSSIVGQYVGLTAAKLRELQEALQAVYSSWDPDQAVGQELDRIGALTGTRRRGATPSTVRMDLILAAGVYTAGVLVVSRLGDPTARFTNIDDVVSPGGLVTGVPFEAETEGEVFGPAGTLTVIANPIVGFTSATNPNDAIVGQTQETDASLRRRREVELARKGSSTVDAIRADLLSALDEDGDPLFDFVNVVENDTDVTDGDGRPPHSFEALLVTGADDTTIATEIFAAKPAGIRAYGLDTAIINDSQGNPHTVGWSLADDIEIWLWVYVDVLSGLYGGASDIQTAIVEWGDEFQTVGDDVIRNRLTQLVMARPGVVDCNIKINNANNEGTSVLTNFTIGAREIARFADVRIVVNSTVVPGTP